MHTTFDELYKKLKKKEEDMVGEIEGKCSRHLSYMEYEKYRLIGIVLPSIFIKLKFSKICVTFVSVNFKIFEKHVGNTLMQIGFSFSSFLLIQILIYSVHNLLR